MAAQQNVYNVGYDLAVSLATLGVGLDGDLVTLKLSIGGDATSQTSSVVASATGSREGGLDTHVCTFSPLAVYLVLFSRTT